MACIIRNRLSTCLNGSKRALHLGAICQKEEFVPDMPTVYEHATGPERKELLAKLAGFDQFDTNVLQRHSGTKDAPTIIPSFNEARIVGCVCHEDANSIVWSWAEKAHLTRCKCGYYIKLVDAVPFTE